MEEGEFITRLQRVEDYKFRISFNKDGIQDMMVDEPKPLGTGEHPNAGKLLSAAVGNCLCASLVFCMERSRSEVLDLTAEVATTLERNEKGRWRITGMTVNIFPRVDDGVKLSRCRQIFEDFCIVTQSVREGIPVKVIVQPLDEDGVPS